MLCECSVCIHIKAIGGVRAPKNKEGSSLGIFFPGPGFFFFFAENRAAVASVQFPRKGKRTKAEEER